MWVVNSEAGQRSNRLVTIANALASAIDEGEELLVTSFDEFKEDYARMVSWPGKVIFGRSLKWRIIRLIIAVFKRCRIIPREGVLRFLKWRVVSDWTFRNSEALAKNEDKIRSFFQPSFEVADFKKKIPGVFIGVHIRRSDYLFFESGRYYYSDDVYFRSMCRLAKNLTDVTFVVFSDEHINHDAFPGLKCIFPKGGAREDQVLMSRCDYLMGPPSTFTMWASFMGKVPLGLIKNRDMVLSLEDFAYSGLQA